MNSDLNLSQHMNVNSLFLTSTTVFYIEHGVSLDR